MVRGESLRHHHVQTFPDRYHTPQRGEAPFYYGSLARSWLYFEGQAREQVGHPPRRKWQAVGLGGIDCPTRGPSHANYLSARRLDVNWKISTKVLNFFCMVVKYMVILDDNSGVLGHFPALIVLFETQELNGMGSITLGNT